MILSPEQSAAVHSQAPRLLLKAGAGSGKTHTLTHRIAQAIANGADPAKCIAISFTVQAGRELAARLAKLGVPALRHTGTLHALCLAEAHKFPTWGHKRPLIIDEDMQAAMIKAELNRLRLDKTVSIRDVAATLASGQATDTGVPCISNRAYAPARAVRRAMVAAGQASMDLLLGEAVHHLPGSLGELDALFWDEFQDTAAGDFALLEQIEAKSKTVVGDEMQSIFGFRGSSPDYFRHLAASHDWQQLTLADNYRSNAAIVDAANRLTAGQTGAITMRHVRPDDWTPPTIANHGTEAAEFAHIREWLAAKHERRYDGSQPTVAILCRHNALAARLRLALADMLPPSPALALDPAMIRQAMRAVQNPGETWHDHHDALPYLRHFTDLCGSSSPEALLPAMAEALAQAEAQASYDFGGLNIGTVHGAKGLEWDHVLLAGAEQASWPEAAELLRLFYVAVTRARDSLTITCARRRPSLHGKGWTESEMAFIVGKL
jgi:DNA helicase-2/ATP-dependent DNA helicase PcrA